MNAGMKSIIYYPKPQRSISVTSQTFPDVVFQSYLWFLEKPVWKSIHIECTEHGLRLASGGSAAWRCEHRPPEPAGAGGGRSGGSCSVQRSELNTRHCRAASLWLRVSAGPALARMAGRWVTGALGNRSHRRGAGGSQPLPPTVLTLLQGETVDKFR